MVFKTIGNRSNPVILFFHAMGVTGESSMPVAKKLAEKFYCVMPTSTVYCDGQEYLSKSDEVQQIIKFLKNDGIEEIELIVASSINFVLRKYGGMVMGDRYISCAAVVQSFMVIVFYPAQGITSGCGTLYSYHYGAGHYDKVMQVFHYVFYLCASYMLILCIAAQLIPEIFVKIFVQERELVILSASCIRKYTLGLLGVAVQYAIVDGLTAMGQIRFALPISFFRKILYIICVFLIPLANSLESVFYSETVSDLVGACVTIIIFQIIILPRLKQKMVKS